MAKCVLCSVELKFSNTPLLGSGKLSSGEGMCVGCFVEINKIDSKVSSSLKKYSVDELKNFLEEHEMKKANQLNRVNEIKDQIKALKLDNLSSFLGTSEIDELPNILSQTERIDNIIQGSYSNGKGILVSTDRRLLFVVKGLIYGLKVEDFPLDKITSIQYETGIIFGKIKIHTSGNIATIDNVDKAGCRLFSEFVREKLSQKASEPRQETFSSGIIEQLEKLAKLKAIGALTEEEFQEQKKKLLNS